MSPKRPDLLVVHQGAELYGSDRMLCQLLATLRKQDIYNITLHLPYDGPLIEHVKDYCDNLIIKPVSILRLSALKKLQWLNLKRFIQNLKTAHRLLAVNNVVILNTTVILGYMLLLSFFRGKKFVYVHELPTGAIKLVLNILLVWSGAELICNSQATAKAYPLIPDKKKHVLYNISSLETTSEPVSSDNNLNILQIGRVSYRKGQHIAIEAVRQLPDPAQKNIHLRIVGDMYDPSHDYLQSLKDAITTLPYTDQVTLLPFDQNPDKHYAWAHVVVVPSIKPESFGLVTLEAMQHARPVIASHIGALPEIVANGKTGYLVTPDNPTELAKALQSYLDNPHLIYNHGQAAQSHVHEKFHISRYNETLTRILQAP